LPEFLDLYIKDISSKTHLIKSIYHLSSDSKINELFKDLFDKYWVYFEFSYTSLDEFNVLAVDSSSRHLNTSNGGLFYVARALGLSSSHEVYRRVDSGFDYCFSSDCSGIISRFMEWLEHLVIIDALNSGFRGFILLDGSLYGRFSHIPLELDLTCNRDFMIKYFEDLLNLLNLSKRLNVPIIGVSKGSVSSFFRNFLIGILAVDVGVKFGYDALWIKELLNKVLDRKRSALYILDKLPEGLKVIVKELLNRRPDFQLILNFAKSTGYSMPLFLSPHPRTIRAFKLIERNAIEFLKSAFPYSSISNEFLDRSIGVIKGLLDLPAIISFHILPSLSDIPLKIDIPAYFFGFEDKFMDFIWPEIIDVDLSNILNLLSSGYCGPENYNIWLSNVDGMVKLSRRVFESIYLPKFEDILGSIVTSRGYRRVRYP